MSEELPHTFTVGVGVNTNIIIDSFGCERFKIFKSVSIECCANLRDALDGQHKFYKLLMEEKYSDN